MMWRDHLISSTPDAEPVPQVELAWDTPRAAKALSLSETWLEQMRLKGNGPPFVKIGRRVLYRPADVSEWLATNLRRSTSDK